MYPSSISLSSYSVRLHRDACSFRLIPLFSRSPLSLVTSRFGRLVYFMSIQTPSGSFLRVPLAVMRGNYVQGRTLYKGNKKRPGCGRLKFKRKNSSNLEPNALLGVHSVSVSFGRSLESPHINLWLQSTFLSTCFATVDKIM